MIHKEGKKLTDNTSTPIPTFGDPWHNFGPDGGAIMGHIGSDTEGFVYLRRYEGDKRVPDGDLFLTPAGALHLAAQLIEAATTSFGSAYLSTEQLLTLDDIATQAGAMFEAWREESEFAHLSDAIRARDERDHDLVGMSARDQLYERAARNGQRVWPSLEHENDDVLLGESAAEYPPDYGTRAERWAAMWDRLPAELRTVLGGVVSDA